MTGRADSSGPEAHRADVAGVEPVLEATGIRVSFDAVEVLHGVDLTLYGAERHAIVGENGAGKSTLMKVICGSLAPDAGTIRVDGEGVAPGLAAAQARGLALVHQELSLVPSMTVSENCLLGHYASRWGLVDSRACRSMTRRMLDEVGLACDPDARVENLSFADRQLVEIAKALLREPRLLVLDEPTSALSTSETSRFLSLLRRLNTERGTTIVYISHRMAEVYDLCTRATVLRDGATVNTFNLDTTSPDTLVRSMVGRSIDLLTRRPTSSAFDPSRRPPLLEVRKLCGPGVPDATFMVGSGEVVGLGGLVGSGRTELARLIVGLEPSTGGEVLMMGEPVRFRSVRSAVRHGVMYVPEDRQVEGLALDLDTGTNATTPSIESETRFGFLRVRALRQLARRVLDESAVRPRDPLIAARSLSGGNQQKLVLGKWLPRDPRLLVLDEPTRGVDVQAKSEIHQRIADLANQGAAVIVISSELVELITLCDRVVVLHEGRTVGEVCGADVTEEAIISLASGHRSAPVVVP